MTMLKTLSHTLNAWMWLIGTEFLAFLAKFRRSPDRHRSVLLLAGMLPPSMSGGVHRPLSFMKYGDQNGWRIAAIGYEFTDEITAAGESLMQSVPPSVRLFRIGASRLEPGWRLFPQIDGGMLSGLAVVSMARRVLAFRPSVVLASGPPFHSFVAAYYLSHIFGARLVLDYRDEWTESPFTFVNLGNSDRYWERRCLAKADLAVFTTQSQIDHAVSVFGELDRDRCLLVPNGWEPGDLPVKGVADGRGEPGTDTDVVLSFVGNLGNHTLPDTFFGTLGVVLSRPGRHGGARVRFVGRRSPKAMDAINAFAHSNAIELIDQVPKAEVFDRMEESDGLLLISLPGLARYIPGKLYDYLSSTRPIVIYGHEGEVSAIVANLGAGMFVPEGDADALADAFDAIRAGPRTRWDTPERRDWIRTHTREAAARKLLSRLGELIGSSDTA